MYCSIELYGILLLLLSAVVLNSLRSSANFYYRHPGYSLFEWRKLCESNTDVPLSERPTLLVSLDDVSKHNTEEDCWTAIRGIYLFESINFVYVQ